MSLTNIPHNPDFSETAFHFCKQEDGAAGLLPERQESRGSGPKQAAGERLEAVRLWDT